MCATHIQLPEPPPTGKSAGTSTENAGNPASDQSWTDDLNSLVAPDWWVLFLKGLFCAFPLWATAACSWVKLPVSAQEDSLSGH